jgi:hypothetical protein
MVIKNSKVQVTPKFSSIATTVIMVLKHFRN